MKRTTRPDPKTDALSPETAAVGGDRAAGAAVTDTDDRTDDDADATRWTSIDEMGGEAPCYAPFFEDPDD